MIRPTTLDSIKYLCLNIAFRHITKGPPHAYDKKIIDIKLVPVLGCYDVYAKTRKEAVK